MKNNDNEIKLILSHAQDCASLASKKSSAVFTAFLSSEQAFLVEKQVSIPQDIVLVFFGGYSQSEYKLAGFFPSFLFYDDSFVPNDDFPICAIFAKGSGFRKLCHRDFLGSLMSLGIKRETVGDIVVAEDGFSATIFCLEKTADYILSSFDSAANDRIVCCKIELSALALPPKKFKLISATVKSPRLDAIVCSCLNSSRDAAEKLISAGLVSINHAACTDKSATCGEGDIISIRHHGRFEIFSFGDKNRRDRLRVSIHQYL